MMSRCAVVLRDLISPYLLRRRKADVATQLPKKTETVLFCNLTEQQRDLYRAYIHSPDVEDILSGRRQALAGIDVLRKICNHPDLLERMQSQGTVDYGDPSRCGCCWRPQPLHNMLHGQSASWQDDLLATCKVGAPTLPVCIAALTAWCGIAGQGSCRCCQRCWLHGTRKATRCCCLHKHSRCWTSWRKWCSRQTTATTGVSLA